MDLALAKILGTDDLFHAPGKWLCDFWLWAGGVNCIMVFPYYKNQPLDVIKASIHFVPILRPGIMDLSRNMHGVLMQLRHF